MALTRTAKHWLLGLLGAGAAGTGYVVWRRHREHGHKQLGSPHGKHPHHQHHKKQGNERGHYGHHHKEHGHGE